MGLNLGNYPGLQQAHPRAGSRLIREISINTDFVDESITKRFHRRLEAWHFLVEALDLHEATILLQEVPHAGDRLYLMGLDVDLERDVLTGVREDRIEPCGGHCHRVRIHRLADL